MQIIAYYLPQFYPFKENNEWWGEGFTEWTNVGKAKPLYCGHDQPKVPADLGYYDLRMAEVKEKQAALAREAGVTAFCYWHYWFGEGKVLLDTPMRQILDTGKPDFPFCLGWANETWMAKVWNPDGTTDGKMLMEQKYPGDADIEAHFQYIKRAISDKRYLRIEDRPVFVIYKPFFHPNVEHFMAFFNKMIREAGIADAFFFIGHTVDSSEIEKIHGLGFDAVNIVRYGEHRFNPKVTRRIPWALFKYKVLKLPLVLNYSFISRYFIDEDVDNKEYVIPTLIPNWDHTPRSGRGGYVFHQATPELFQRHAEQALRLTAKKTPPHQVLFVKSWNEWGEGNYMEPDLTYGKGYIHALAQAVKLFSE
jgi:hypothetical protein